MLLQRLRLYETVLDEGSIVAAAKIVRLAQPALSRQMVALEREVGVALMHRERRGVSPTPAGQVLRIAALDLMARLDEAVHAAVDAHAGTSGSVRLGVTRLALDTPRVTRAIAAVRGQWPGIRLHVTDAPSLHQAHALRARELDVAIGFSDNEGDALVRREVLYEETIDAVLLPPFHPLAKKTSVHISELRGERFITMRRPLVGGYVPMYQALHDAGITDMEEHESTDGLFAMVAAGRGWAMLSRTRMQSPPPGTVVVPLRGIAFQLPASLRWRGTDRSRATQNVVTSLRNAFAGGMPRPAERRSPRITSRVQDVEIEQLVAFLAAVEEGSMSGAAIRLRLTQSGVSRRVRALERAVGCPLVERVTHGVFATNAGEAFRTRAEQVVRLADVALARARFAAGDVAGVCRIGALAPEITGGLQHLAMRRVTEELPRVRIELAEMLPDRQIELLRSGEIDIGLGESFVASQAPAELSSVELMEDVIDSVLLPEGHALATQAWVRPDELADEPFLFIERDRARRFYDTVLGTLGELGLASDIVGTHGGVREVWRLIAAGRGWTLGTRGQRARPPVGLVGVPLEGLHIPWGVSLLWRRNEESATVRQVLDVFRTTKNPEVAVVVATVRASAGGRVLHA